MELPFLSKLADNTLAFVFGIGGASYLFHRRFKNDSRNDKVADANAAAEVSIIEKLQTQIDAERDHSTELGKTIDRLAEERNAAVETAGMLKGKVESLQQQVGHLSDQVNDLQLENAELHRLIIDSSENVRALELAIQTLLRNLNIHPCAMEPECPKKGWKP